MSNAEPFVKERIHQSHAKVNQFQQQTAEAAHEPSLRDYVDKAVSNYFSHLGDQDISGVYDMVLSEVETPLLEVVMKYTRHNQTKAAQVLGLNRGTLRKKLKQYGLL